MKLLHVIPYFSPVYGGPVQAVRDIATMQAESGITVEIATTTADGATELAIGDRNPSDGDGVPVHYFERRFPRSWFRSPAMADWLMRHARDHDALHLHVPFTYPLHFGVHAAQCSGRPYVITPHGVLDPWSLRHKQWKKIPYLRLLERTHLSGASIVHVTSSLEEQGLRALGITGHIRRIPLAVPLPPTTPQRRVQRDLRLLFLSRLHAVKDLPTLLRACTRIKQRAVKLTIAGEGEPVYARAIRSMASGLGLAATVDFVGHLDDRAKRRIWETHDVFVLPSLHENFSLATIEAMATGMPAIITDQVGVADRIAASGAGRVVPVSDPTALADAIVAMEDVTLRLRAGEQARLLVEREFSTEVVRAAYAGLAAELIAGSG